MKKVWVPVLLCLSLLVLPTVLRAEPAAPANPVAAPAAAVAAVQPQGCDQLGSLAALDAAPVCQASPTVVTNPLAGAVPQAFVCCTAQDKADCKAECGTCISFAHCIAAECVCQCFC